jgi:hypothetical protein
MPEVRRFQPCQRTLLLLGPATDRGQTTTSGEVVVRSITTGDGHAEYTPIGHSTGLAARMQTLAPIGSIAATQRTQRLCEGYFAFKSLVIGTYGFTVAKPKFKDRVGGSHTSMHSTIEHLQSSALSFAVPGCNLCH